MHVASILGWLIIVACGVALIAMRRNDKGEGPPYREPSNECCDKKWCEAVERLVSGSAFLFDGRLRLVAIGERGSKMIGRTDPGGHIVDVVPSDCVSLLLEYVALARRQGICKWRCAWDGEQVDVVASSLGAGRVVLCVRLEKQS